MRSSRPAFIMSALPRRLLSVVAGFFLAAMNTVAADPAITPVPPLAQFHVAAAQAFIRLALSLK